MSLNEFKSQTIDNVALQNILDQIIALLTDIKNNTGA